MIRHRPTRALLLALCLFVLCAQQFSLAHGVWHAARGAPADAPQSLGAADDHPHSTDKVCDFDAAFGQLLNGTPTTEHSFAPDPTDARWVLNGRSACATADAVTPRSRGPPASL